MSNVTKKTRNGLIAALDIGTTKVSCFVARAHKDQELEIVGLSHQIANGLRRGVIVDMEAAERSIRSAVHVAEEMADDTIDRVIVSLSGGQPKAQIKDVETNVPTAQIGNLDIQRLFTQARVQGQLPQDHVLLHTMPTDFTVNGEAGIRDPRGMVGERLSARMNLISANSSTVRNLKTCLERCHLDVEEEVISAYASGLGCLVTDEMNLGVCVVDMGGGTTDIAVFIEGNLIHVDSIPVGGIQVTNDISRGLNTPVAHAERMKTKFGSCLPAPSDDHEILRVPVLGEEDEAEGTTESRSTLVSIIQPRLEETFELVRERLENSGLDKVIGRQVVLTGGAAQLRGVPELASRILSKRIRIARPQRLKGLADATSGPEFSTCIGLLKHAHEKQGAWPLSSPQAGPAPNHLFGKLGVWFKQNF
ncbi:cell division protein FtsA [Terasakiella brassicae]|uniref:Cell division protein FtsA n=1 Tax=Terasakiella brassicae TaxID=1634917 RepID=A0A917C0A9_9PROT|nr:cell division protein FtsA [Terasakiella brassicae]GGF61843.1 cell division protein FtsA [Terasakiella brassicae]